MRAIARARFCVPQARARSPRSTCVLWFYSRVVPTPRSPPPQQPPRARGPQPTHTVRREVWGRAWARGADARGRLWMREVDAQRVDASGCATRMRGGLRGGARGMRLREARGGCEGCAPPCSRSPSARATTAAEAEGGKWYVETGTAHGEGSGNRAAKVRYRTSACHRSVHHTTTAPRTANAGAVGWHAGDRGDSEGEGGTAGSGSGGAGADMETPGACLQDKQRAVVAGSGTNSGDLARARSLCWWLCLCGAFLWGLGQKRKKGKKN